MANNQIKAHCNVCGGEKWHYIRALYRKLDEHPEDPSMWVRERAEILECGGCSELGFRTTWTSSENFDDNGPVDHVSSYPPATFRREPSWFTSLGSGTSTIAHLLAEVYVAMQNDAPALAAMGMRAIIEHIMIEKVGDRGSFAVNMKSFQNDGHISKVQAESLDATLELGHASTHRSFRPTQAQLGLALDITEHLVHGLYILPDAAKRSSKGIPPRAPRRSKAP